MPLPVLWKTFYSLVFSLMDVCVTFFIKINWADATKSSVRMPVTIQLDLAAPIDHRTFFHVSCLLPGAGTVFMYQFLYREKEQYIYMQMSNYYCK